MKVVDRHLDFNRKFFLVIQLENDNLSERCVWKQKKKGQPSLLYKKVRDLGLYEYFDIVQKNSVYFVHLDTSLYYLEMYLFDAAVKLSENFVWYSGISLEEKLAFSWRDT